MVDEIISCRISHISQRCTAAKQVPGLIVKLVPTRESVVFPRIKTVYHCSQKKLPSAIACTRCKARKSGRIFLGWENPRTNLQRALASFHLPHGAASGLHVPHSAHYIWGTGSGGSLQGWKGTRSSAKVDEEEVTSFDS